MPASAVSAHISNKRKRKNEEARQSCRYPLPKELLLVEHEREPLSAPWPARSLIFKAWTELRDAMLRDVLVARGWTDGGGACDPERYDELALALSGKHPNHPLPRRAVWIANDGKEVVALHHAFSRDPALAARFRTSGFPGTASAAWKTYTARALAGQPFVPKTFVLPAQRAELLAAAKADGKAHWVGKPRCNYAGREIVVAADARTVADGVGVVQRYIHEPLLIGGYKFHMRVYLLATSLSPPRAYVHPEMAVMFATMPYTLAAPTLGDRFEQRVHLTNYDINARPSNVANYLADKPGVGRGCLWDTKRLEAWLAEHRPDVCLAEMWRQIRLIGRAAAQSVCAHPNVAKALKAYPHAQAVGYELFGIDVMLDADGKCWLLELNDSPGLEYCGSHFEGTPSPDAADGDATTRAVIDDTLALLGLDRSVCDAGDPSRFLRVC